MVRCQEGGKLPPLVIQNIQPPGRTCLSFFFDRLIVQTVENSSVSGNATNQLVILAVQAKHPGTNEQGVIIVCGLSAQPEGAPGPYGVYSLAKNFNVEKLLISSSDEAAKASEKWDFAGENNEKFYLEMNYAPDVPGRSHSLTRAYSYKDPVFYRIYDEDQGVIDLLSVPKEINKISNLDFQIDVPQLNIKLNTP